MNDGLVVGLRNLGDRFGAVQAAHGEATLGLETSLTAFTEVPGIVDQQASAGRQLGKVEQTNRVLPELLMFAVDQTRYRVPRTARSCTWSFVSHSCAPAMPGGQ